MVFFNCNACGEALKKNQVEKHTFRCRYCEVLSCVDCGKDFWGNDYQNHTKCMTEDEKYCGQGYVPKVNKGEVKQEQWIEKVQNAIDKADSNPNLKKLLIRLKDYPNIPRKQQKFQNFLKNSLRIYDNRLVTQVWDTLMTHSAQEESKKENTESVNGKHTLHETNGKVEAFTSSHQDEPRESVNGKHTSHETNGEVETSNCSHHDETSVGTSEAKKSKRERKEERRNKANKKEKKDRAENSENGEECVKRSKKRKHASNDSECDKALVENTTSDDQPRKKKKKGVLEQTIEVLDSTLDLETVENRTNGFKSTEREEKEVKKKIKFSWEKTIMKVLEAYGELSLKKLRKKVLNEFSALGAANYSEENLLAKFDKKVRKMPNVQVLKERAKLKD